MLEKAPGKAKIANLLPAQRAFKSTISGPLAPIFKSFASGSASPVPIVIAVSL